MISVFPISFILALSLLDFTQASAYHTKAKLLQLHQRQTDFSDGTCYIANDVRKGYEVISHTTISLAICGPTSSSSYVLSASTSSASASSTPSATSATTTSQVTSEETLIGSTTSSSTSAATNSTSSTSSDSTSTLTPAIDPVMTSESISTTVNSTISTATPDSTPTTAPILPVNPIIPSVVGNILVRLSSNGTAIGNLSICPDTGDSSASTYYYYSNDSTRAIQFSFTPSADPLAPIPIQFASSIQPGFNYLGIEDNNSGRFGVGQTGAGTIAAITQGGGANMFDTSNSFDGATNSSQATIWTFDASLVMSAQFFNAAGAGTTNISVVAFDHNGSDYSNYSYLTVMADGAPIPLGGYGVYFTFTPM